MAPSRLMPALAGRSLLLAFLWASLALAACQGSGPSPTAAPTPSPTPILRAVTHAPPPTPTSPPAASLISGEEAYRHVLALTQEIGSRPAGSDAEGQAAQYIVQRLSEYGYQAEMEEFRFELYVEGAAILEVVAPQRLSLNPSALRFSIGGEVIGELAAAGLGRPQDYPPQGLDGRIALIERGGLTFSEKVANAAAAGARAVVIYNNREGPFQGDLQEESSIAAVSISQAEGRQLIALLEEAALTVHLSVEAGRQTKASQNILGRSPQDDCRVIVGAHYDSVAAGPGANDNASGIAVLLEIARVLDLSGGEEGVCFAAFGAEEPGLFGSHHLVASLVSQGQATVQAMINLDMVAVGDQWQLAGSPSLVEKVDQGAAALGLDPVPSEPRRSSDHLSFMDAGIPALLIHRFDDPRNHTELDQAQFVEPHLLEEAAALALLALGQLLSP